MTTNFTKGGILSSNQLESISGKKWKKGGILSATQLNELSNNEVDVPPTNVVCGAFQLKNAVNNLTLKIFGTFNASASYQEFGGNGTVNNGITPYILIRQSTTTITYNKAPFLSFPIASPMSNSCWFIDPIETYGGFRDYASVQGAFLLYMKGTSSVLNGIKAEITLGEGTFEMVRCENLDNDTNGQAYLCYINAENKTNGIVVTISK